jgi:GAF domain-containing protein
LVLHTGAGEIGRQMVAQGRQINLYQEQSLVARAARTRLGVVVNDVQTEPGFLPNPLLPETRAEMAVPLIAGSQVLGVLDVQSATVGRFTEEEVSIFTTLASQVAVALQNARRYNEAQRALDELQRIQRVLVREGWQAFLLAKERPLQGFYYDQQTARPIVQSQAEDPADVTAVTTALTVRGQTIGKIGVRNPSGAPLNDNQRLLLATLTAQVSEALERARLSEQTQLALTESDTLAQLSARLNAAQTYQDITRAITSLINARIHKPAVAVLFEIDVNAQGQPEWMNLMATEDTGDATDAFQRFPVNLFTAEPLWVHNSSRPTFIADAQNDPRLAPTEKEIYKLNGTVSIVYLPLRLAGRWIGLFSLAWTEPITFTTTDERLLTAVLNQLALSMNSIQLLKIAEKRARQEQLLREVSARVSATVDAESVLKTAVREIGRALGLETFIYLKNQQTLAAMAQPSDRNGRFCRVRASCGTRRRSPMARLSK